ncbi:hypothetical protein LIER_27420 [Lithospermum erythrorhizon]|uniref:Uncharacterized protein n=1 Tax=Lithospermum erythrorhizon TaxID=34254 RepID=A0AAV3RFF0_LITER
MRDVNTFLMIRVGEGSERVFDNKGLVSYTAVKWTSPVEFVTGGLGLELQWWDMRGPGGVFKVQGELVIM